MRNTTISLHLSLSLLLSLFLCFSLNAQSCQDASVELWADVQTSPARITLHWIPNPGAISHFVYRKSKGSSNWGAVIGNLPGTATEFADTTAQVETNYEYRVLRQAAAYTGYGYINAGIEIPAVENRGVLIFLIDQTFSSSLSEELTQWINDAFGDGWIVLNRFVDRNATPAEVKALIKEMYDENGSKTKALFLFGHIPVPYSGDLNPDGHPDHLGAWPADVYYADINGTWTDNTINDVVANDERNDNIPDDGKFDQSVLPSDVELQVGRVDFANMPSFAASEEELLRNYLIKDHAYRHKLFTTVARAVVDDNFGYFGGEAFAASGYKNIGPIVGPSNVFANDYLSTMADSSYQWSYGCGGGWFQGAGGVGSTGDFANAHTQSVFTMLFGSYFGDWDSQDNFLRAPLAQGLTLTNAWSGRPHWVFHHMGLGETVGYAARTTQNNSVTYFSSYGARFVSIALMGDPTLRSNVVAPASNLIVVEDGYHAKLSWDPSPDDIVGYNIYRFANGDEEWTKVNDTVVTTLVYTDYCLAETDSMLYAVKALKLEHTPSGTYYNQSQDTRTRFGHFFTPEVTADATYTLEGGTASFVNASFGAADNFLWNFGDGQFSTELNPVHIYGEGDYLASLIVWNECQADTIYLSISVLTGTNHIQGDEYLMLSPNPTKDMFSIRINDLPLATLDIRILDATGKVVLEKTGLNQNEAIHISSLASGMYPVWITSGNHLYRSRLMIVH